MGMRMYKRVNKKRWCACVCITLLLCCVFCVRVSAEESDALAMPDGYEDVKESLPNDVIEALPEGMLSEDLDEQGTALQNMASPAYWLDVVSDVLQKGFRDGVRKMALLCGLLLFAAVLRTIRSSLASEALGAAVDFCSTGAVFAAILHWQSEQLSACAQFFERLHTLMLAMIPVGGTLLAMGGNVSTAAASSGTMSFFLTVSETLCARSIMPVTATCTALLLCRMLSPDASLSGVHNAIRKIYTFTLGLVMTLLCALLSAQTTLSAAADSTGARAARLVSATVIPVVGGAVGETLRTLSSGVQYLKSIFGIGGIFFLCLLILPTLLSLLITRTVLLFGSGVAEMLGCERERSLLSELGGVWGIMIAVVAMSGVMFLLALTIFVRVAVAAA